VKYPLPPFLPLARRASRPRRFLPKVQPCWTGSPFPAWLPMSCDLLKRTRPNPPSPDAPASPYGVGISKGMSQVLCFQVRSARKTQFTGEGNSLKNPLEKLRGRETIYLAGLEAVGTTSANNPVCNPPILGRVVHNWSCKEKQGEGPTHGG
jgi:hypothetical protein